MVRAGEVYLQLVDLPPLKSRRPRQVGPGPDLRPDQDRCSAGGDGCWIRSTTLPLSFLQPRIAEAIARLRQPPNLAVIELPRRVDL